MFRTTYDPTAKLWSGKSVPPLYNPSVSMAYAILKALSNYGPKIAQINDDTGVQLTFDEIRIRTIRASQNLQKRGYNTKKLFGLFAKNSHHVTPIIFASMCLGCPILPVDPFFDKTELIQTLKLTEPSLVFCDVEAYETIIECLNELNNTTKIFTFGGSIADAEPVENLFAETGNEDEFLPVDVDGLTEIAISICTSGTTGFKKCANWSHAALLDETYQTPGIKYDDRILSFSPIYWISGLSTLLFGTLNGATRITTTETFSPELQIRLIEMYRPTFVRNPAAFMIATMEFVRLSNADLSSVKTFLFGGNFVPAHVRDEMKSYLPNGDIWFRYGMTEIGLISLYFHSSGQNGSVGQLLHGSHVKIIDANGNRCTENVDGEICIKKHYKFSGYYGRKQASDECFDSEGFFKTGDIGHFDKNDNLHVIGRKKFMLTCNGTLVSPSAIEGHLIKMPGIKFVCVIGIPENGNDLPAAIVVRNDNSNITEAEVYDFVADHFSNCQLRGGVYFVESISTIASGKILRPKAREVAIKLYKASTRSFF